MSELRKRYLQDKNLGPVKVAYLERLQGGKPAGVEGMEISFKESSPVMRNRTLWYSLLALTFLSLIPFLLLLEPVSTIIWIGFWADGELDAEQKLIAYIVLAGSAIFVTLAFYIMRPPFRSDVLINIDPANDSVQIRRGGRRAEDVPLSQTRGVEIGQHPELETAQIRFDDRPTRAMKRHVNIYRQVECIFLVMGQTMAMNMVEVASVMGPQTYRANLAMRIRATLDELLQAGRHIQREMAARGGPPPRAEKPEVRQTPVSSEPVVRRRRKGKIK